MTAKLFRNSMAVAVSVMALSIILFMGVLYQYFSDQMMEALGTETWLVARGVELEGLNYLDGLDSENRVTWVAADGTVLFDSSTDSAAMENHGNREEIREAQENRLGAATRYSSTLAEQTLYSARRLSDGTVIRLASSQRTVWLLLLSMVQPILVILVLALLLSVVLASRLSRSIIRPIAELDLEHPEDCDAYDELAPLLTRIKRQNDTIKQQMGQLQQKQTEFSALTENMAEGFLLLDRQGRVLSHNPGALRLLGAEVVPVKTGTATLKDAVSEAMREWTSRIADTHYCLGSVMGPHPFPAIVRDFQAVISREIKAQLLEKEGRLPDAVLACVGGGSNAIGSFYHFIGDRQVRLIGCEAAGRGVDTPETAATIATGKLGIFHGMKSYFCQDQYGQIAPVYSISAGLDYPGIGPEHAHLHDIGRAEYVPVTDEEAVCAFEYLARTEGIIPAIESAHAVAYGQKLAPTMGKDQIIVITVSGRGDKDCAAIARYRGEDLHE